MRGMQGTSQGVHFQHSPNPTETQTPGRHRWRREHGRRFGELHPCGACTQRPPSYESQMDVFLAISRSPVPRRVLKLQTLTADETTGFGPNVTMAPELPLSSQAEGSSANASSSTDMPLGPVSPEWKIFMAADRADSQMLYPTLPDTTEDISTITGFVDPVDPGRHEATDEAVGRYGDRLTRV
jgi:hypothetical protein